MVEAARFIDYFAVYEFDEEKERNGVSCGRMVQRFPAVDWPDFAFGDDRSSSFDVLCMPHGWALAGAAEAPRFLVNALTNELGGRFFAACLSFHEARPADAADDAPLFRPKCLVLISHEPLFDAFRVRPPSPPPPPTPPPLEDCLVTLYVTHVNEPERALEPLVAALVGAVRLPANQERSVCYSLNGVERLSLRTARSASVPTTGTRVANLFTQLGTIHNVLCLFCAALTDQKILFHSQSYNRLADACHALSALLYPFKWNAVYVPILPHSLSELVASPTPFIYGVHSSLKSRIVVDAYDAIAVDLDYGSVFIPEHLRVPALPEPQCSRLLADLTMVLNPHLQTADLAIRPLTEVDGNSDALTLDKRLRACVLRFFADLLAGYRSCLQLVRVQPQPYVAFHRAAFVGLRRLGDDDFVQRLLGGLSFQTFVPERGAPFRHCDLFDRLCADYSERRDGAGQLDQLAQQLLDNEFDPRDMQSEVPRLHDAAALDNPPPFPFLDAALVDAKLKSVTSTPPPDSRSRSLTNAAIIETGSYAGAEARKSAVGADVRRLEVLRNCLRMIFDNRVPEARKLMSAVSLSMKSAAVRVCFCRELIANLRPQNRGTMEPQQFDLIIRLMNCALENESVYDENGIAYSLLTSSNMYCRRLTPGVHQFAYTCIQEHAVWSEYTFWQSAFFHDVQQLMRDLYLPKAGAADESNAAHLSVGLWNLSQSPSTLDVAARVLRAKDRAVAGADGRVRDEEEIVFGQMVHYTNLMVYLRTPLDATKLRRVNVEKLELRSAGGSRGAEESDSGDSDRSDAGESGFVDGGARDLGNDTVDWICEFVRVVCGDARLPNDKIVQLLERVPGFVALHVDNLEQVHRESKRLPPIQKPKLLAPALVPGEAIVKGNLRVFLLPDGRLEESPVVERIQSSYALPAEGALFLTNYRIVFKGQPCNPYICEQVVVRSVPLMSVTRCKRLGQHFLLAAGADQTSPTHHHLHCALQIRSAVFQLLKVAFDEEVSVAAVDEFEALLQRLRWPDSLGDVFALNKRAAGLASSAADASRAKSHATISAKYRIFKTAVGIGNSASRRSNVETSSPKAGSLLRRSAEPAGAADSLTLKPSSPRWSDSALISDLRRVSVLPVDGNGVSSFLRDFRLSLANLDFSLCESYPSAFAVPAKVGDESLRKCAKGHRRSRLPLITWRGGDGALLLRGAAFQAKSVATALRHTAAAAPGAQNEPTLRSAVEQERYVAALTALSPAATARQSGADSASVDGSVLSLDSLMLTSMDAASVDSATPDMARKPFSAISDQLSRVGRNSGGKAASKTMVWTSGRGIGLGANLTTHQRNPSTSSTLSAYKAVQSSRGSSSKLREDTSFEPGTLTRSSLYIFGEKEQMKMAKLDKQADFVPVRFPTSRVIKVALKKFLRVMAPSATPLAGDDDDYLKRLGESSWLQQVGCLLRVAGAAVDLIDIQNSSVALCLEDGWDATAQLSSLTQIMLDEHYRTISGLRMLIEKEWLCFGHRFSYRLNHTADSSATEMAPMLLLLLDALHQLSVQFPAAFEFNDFFLRFVAYHSCAAYFQTFLGDSEKQRLGLCADSTDRPILQKSQSSNGPMEPAYCKSMWDFIDDHCTRRPTSTLFYNLKYLPDAHGVLRAQSSCAVLDLWQFYAEDYLAHGSAYDLAAAESERQSRLADQTLRQELVGLSRKARRVVDLSYDSPDCIQLDGLQARVEELNQLLTDLGREVRQWDTVRRSLREASVAGVSDLDDDDDEVATYVDGDVAWRQWLRRAAHKRRTVELLLCGRNAGRQVPLRAGVEQRGAAGISSHQFERVSFPTPEQCAACQRVIWNPLSKQSGLRCRACGTCSHDKCAAVVDVGCRPVAVEPAPVRAAPIAEHDDEHVVERASTGGSTERRVMEATVQSECHCGYLWKRGARFKAWKARYFVLDAARHSLRYYDDESDQTCRGGVDLADIVSVNAAAPPPLASSRSHAHGAYFDIRTSKRVYSLMAQRIDDANTWIEKIQACIQ